MTQTATFTLEKFIDDVRLVFASSTDPRTQAQGIAAHMKVLLAVPGWLEEKISLPPGSAHERVDLHYDDKYGHPNAGFLFMCSIFAGGELAKQGPGTFPHNHGAAFVVYGVYKGANRQSKWRWVYPEGDRVSPQITSVETWVQMPGEVAFFLPGEIHSQLNVHDGETIVIRLEAKKLDTVGWRHRYDPETNTAQVW